MADKVKGTWGQWVTNLFLSAFIGFLGLLPFGLRGKLVAAAMRGPLGKLTGYRKRIQKNLDHVYPDMDATSAKQIADDVLENAGRTFIENLFPLDFQKHATDLKLFGAGVDALLEAQKNGRGVLLFSGHFGNHEALRLALFEHGIKVGAIYRPMSNPYFNNRYLDAIQIGGRSGNLFETGKKGVQGFVNALTKGEVQVLLIDLAVASGEEISFLGKPAMTSTAAAAFALRTDALFLPYFTLRKLNKSAFSVEIGAHLVGDNALEMTKAATAVVEKQIEADPGNWFWVHRRWKPWV